jgi:hypothetical protein
MPSYLGNGGPAVLPVGAADAVATPSRNTSSVTSSRVSAVTPQVREVAFKDDFISITINSKDCTA